MKSTDADTPASCQTQIETNLQGVQSRQLQIQAILEAVDRDQERRLLADRQLADLESAAAADPGTGRDGRPRTVARPLSVWRPRGPCRLRCS